jgi:hypothetical protein
MIRSLLLSGIAAVGLAACNGEGVTIGGAAAPTTEAEKAAMATEIATLMTDPQMMDQMFSAETMAASLPDMSAMCAAVPADQAAACTQRMEGSRSTIQSVQTEMMDKARAMQPQLMADMGAIMARVYTGEELVAMKAFYASDEGRSILQKQPQVMAEYMPVVMQRMQPLQLEMVQELSQRMTNAAAANAPGATIPGATVPGAAPVPGAVTAAPVTPAPTTPVAPPPTTPVAPTTPPT